MPKPRKTRRDTAAGAAEERHAPDLTTTAPPLDGHPGASALDAFGLAYARRVWLSRAEWTLADLSMLCTLALTAQQLERMAPEVLSAPTVIPVGSSFKPNPVFAQFDALKMRLQALNRDMGLRVKDRDHRPEAEEKTADPTAADLPPGADVEWLDRFKSGAGSA